MRMKREAVDTKRSSARPSSARADTPSTTRVCVFDCYRVYIVDIRRPVRVKFHTQIDGGERES